MTRSSATAADREPAAAAFGEPDAYAATLPGAADDPSIQSGNGCEARKFRATAIDEVEILADIGRDGWELTGVRDFGLHARRPRDPAARTPWEYARRTAVRRGPLVDEMTPAWTPCGRWLTFHYFKRPCCREAECAHHHFSRRRSAVRLGPP